MSADIIAGNIQRRREALGLTQAEAARRAGISRSLWCMMESGQRAQFFVKVLQIANAIDIDVASVFDGAGAKPHHGGPMAFNLGGDRTVEQGD